MSEKVFITGAGGFIGSHLAEKLVTEGYSVKCLVHYNALSKCGWLDEISVEVRREMEIVHGDVRDSDLLDSQIRGVSKVFHLAALIAIPYSYIAEQSYIETNVMGCLNVLKSCRRHCIEKLMVTSTSEVYGSAKYVPIEESHPRQAQSPYAASKISADALTESFIKSYGLPAVIVRPFNTYGPRQSDRAVTPAIITQLIGGKKKIDLGALTPTRDLVYVGDTVEGFLRISKCDSLTGTDVNIATETETSIGGLAELISNVLGIDFEIVKDDARMRPETSEVERLLGSSKKLLEHTGWMPAMDLRSGISETVNWFRNKYKRHW